MMMKKRRRKMKNLNEFLGTLSEELQDSRIDELRIPGVSTLIDRFKAMKKAHDTKKEKKFNQWLYDITKMDSMTEIYENRYALDYALVAGYIDEKTHQNILRDMLKYYEQQIEQAKQNLEAAKKNYVPEIQKAVKSGEIEVLKNPAEEE